MFGMLKSLVVGVVTWVKVVVGVAVAGVVVAGSLHLLGAGAVAGVIVSAVTWIGEKAGTALLASVAMLVDTVQVLGLASALLVGFLLLGLACVIFKVIEAIAEPVVLGYRSVRPARPAEAA